MLAEVEIKVGVGANVDAIEARIDTLIPGAIDRQLNEILILLRDIDTL